MGVSRFDSGTPTRFWVKDYFEGSDSLEGESVFSMAVGHNGEIWITTQKNIAAFDGNRWLSVTPPGNYYFLESPEQNRGLVVFALGNVWVVAYSDSSSSDSVIKYDGAQWSTFPGPGEEIRLITLGPEQTVWVATSRNKINILDPQTGSWMSQFEERQFGAGKSAYALNAMQFDQQGRLWIATDYGLEIYDGFVWIRYHMHTADLYSNDIFNIVVLGDGPQLPALATKATGSVRGKLVNQDSAVYSDAQVEICLKPVTEEFSGETPCAEQAYNVVAAVNADGRFILTDIPAGRYYLMGKVSQYSSWSTMVNLNLHPTKQEIEFEVKPGAEIDLGEIATR